MHNGKRHYTCPITDKQLPSVTTILGETSDKTHLIEWQKRMGEQRAKEISTNACNVGTHIHKHCENYLLGNTSKSSNPYAKSSEQVANVIIQKGLVGRFTEVWGIECPLFMPGLYAGTSDGIGMYDNLPSIVDFKGTNKLKKEEWIEGYKLQCTAYAMAHNVLFGTEICQAAILLVCREAPNDYQEFVFPITLDLQEQWLMRIEQYELKCTISE